ncbi:MAG: hypothetical protein ACLTM8_00360 [Veillonella parvula]
MEKGWKKTDRVDLYRNIEMPLIFVLADMEKYGIKADKTYLPNTENALKRYRKNCQ